MAPPTPETVTEARELIARGKKIQAIKLIREHTGMDLIDGKSVVEALSRGEDVVAPTPGASLAGRARELRAQDRIADAVRLVAGETGMSEREAARFLDSLD